MLKNNIFVKIIKLFIDQRDQQEWILKQHVEIIICQLKMLH